MILLTGASGFIGKHLLEILVERYGQEKVLALSSAPIKGYQYLIHNNYHFNDDYFLESGFSSIDTIIHAGAFTPKSGKDANNIEGSFANIYNTQKLLSADLPDLKKIIFLSTLDVYGRADIITEQTTVEPVSLYGHSKYYCEKLIEIFGKEKSIVTQILRVGHVYGPGEEQYQKVIPVTFKKLLQNSPLQVWGSGEEKRSFIFIKDVITAIIASVELNESISPVNLVGAQAVSIKNLLSMMMKVADVTVTIEKLPASSGVRDLVFDNTKMRQFLLQSETPLHQGLFEEWKYMKELMHENLL